jgi:hypothetical protein
MLDNELPKWRRAFMTNPDETYETKQAALENEAAKNGGPPRCLACGSPENIVWVHGHGQCAYCHMNVMPCCDGEQCEPNS